MSFDLSLQGLHTFMSTHSGRDQFGNFVQFFSQTLTAILADQSAKLSKDDAGKIQIKYYRLFFKRIMVAVGDARRTVRWLASLGLILALKKLSESNVCPWPNNPKAFVVAQLSMLMWHFGDNYRWLIMNQLVTGDQNMWKRISFSGFALSSLVGSVYYANEIYNPNKGMLVDVQKEKATQRNLLKSALQLVSSLHTSELFITHDAIAGGCGAVAAGIVIWETFPKKSKENSN
jgi:hypothetical protein